MSYFWRYLVINQSLGQIETFHLMLALDSKLTDPDPIWRGWCDPIARWSLVTFLYIFKHIRKKELVGQYRLKILNHSCLSAVAKCFTWLYGSWC